MSEQTRQALDDAIRAHANDEWSGDLPVDWVLVTALTGVEEPNSIGILHSRDPMPAYVSTGLLTEALALGGSDD